MLMPKAHLSIMMVAPLLLLNGCAVKIADFQVCSPIPGANTTVCDWFLHSDQQILTEPQWITQQVLWQSQGQAVECVNSQTLGNIKKEIEKLCSVWKCSYSAQTKITTGLQKLQTMGESNIP